MDKIKFDTTEIPFPLTWNEEPQDVINTFTSEAGTDEEIITRKDKMKISASFKSTSAWASTFKSFYKKDSFTITQYDILTDTTEERTVRMKNFKASLEPKSWLLDSNVTQGVWNISFSLEEF